MATNFPTSVDVLTNPVSNDSLNSPSHSAQHANANDAIEAVESYLLTEPFGMRLIKKQVIGSAVTSVTVTGAFSAAYENYKIIVAGGVGSLSGELYFVAGSITSGYNSNLTYGTFGSNAAPLSVSNTNASYLAWAGGYSTDSLNFELDIRSPFLAMKKTAIGTFIQTTGSNGQSRHWINSTASATAFTLNASAGTITGGTIYVYGYTI